MVVFNIGIAGAIDTDADKALDILGALASLCASHGLKDVKGYIEHSETIKGALE